MAHLPKKSSPLLDDFHTWYWVAPIHIIELQLQMALNFLGWLAHLHGSCFSPYKTFAMHFYFLQVLHPWVDLALNGLSPLVETLQFIGLLFDSHLKGAAHMKQLTATCQHSLNVL